MQISLYHRLCPITVYRIASMRRLVFVLMWYKITFLSYRLQSTNDISVECHYFVFFANMIKTSIKKCQLSWPFLLNHRFRLSQIRYFWFCNCSPHEMCLPPHLPYKYWIRHVTIRLFNVKVVFPIVIFYRGPLAVFCTVDWPFASSTLVHFLAV